MCLFMYKKLYKFFIILFLLFAYNAYGLTYLFSHGFADRSKQVNRYVKEYRTRRGKIKKNKFYIIDGKIKVFNYPDAACKPFVNIFKACLGQEKDLQALRRAYHQIDDDEIVLVGVSRGASTIATFMGVDKPKKIKAVVLISPFDHLINVFKPTRFSRFLYRLFKKLSCFNENGKHPIDWMCKMDKTIPIIFVCSKIDKTVPCRSTINLYRSLVTHGHKKVYLLCLPEGKHAKLLKSSCAEMFQNIVHAFYCAYNLPNNGEFACMGKKLLEKCAYFQEGHKDKDIEDMGQNGDNGLPDAFITILAYLTL